MINEVFKSPTVKNVIFQVKFPNLFYLEKLIGSIQFDIMNVFPESSLIMKRQLLLTEIGSEGKLSNIPDDIGEPIKKIWQFKSSKKYTLNITNDTLDITSEHHKSYNQGDGDKFRDTISLVMDCFFKHIPIPIISRIGLRYIDECPISTKTNRGFRLYYNSVFPLKRFDISIAEEMDFKTVVRKGDYYIRYVESLQKREEKNILVLDFDGYSFNIEREKYLDVLDDIHSLISSEFEATAKEPLFKYMRRQEKDA